MYKVFHTHKFDKEFIKRFSREEQRELEKVEKKQLVENPYVGDSLGYKFFREKKIGSKRVYYLIYEDLKTVLLVGVSDKKSQQETIDEIKSKLTEYFLVVKDALKQHGEFDHA